MRACVAKRLGGACVSWLPVMLVAALSLAPRTIAAQSGAEPTARSEPEASAVLDLRAARATAVRLTTARSEAEMFDPEMSGSVDSPQVALELDRADSLERLALGAEAAALNAPRPRERPSTFSGDRLDAESIDLGLRWNAIDSDLVEIGVLGGLRTFAVRYDADGGYGGLGDERTARAVPVIGSDVRLKLTDSLLLGGAASTHAIATGATLLQFEADATLRLHRNVSLSAGYRFIESTIDMSGPDPTLDQEGVFARLVIKF